MTHEEIIYFNKKHKINSYPGTMRKVRSVFDSLPLEAVTAYRDFWQTLFTERYGKGEIHAARFLSRSLSLLDKYVKERTDTVDVTRNRLINRLNVLLSAFKERYMYKIHGFAAKQYQWALEKWSWNAIDWIATSYTSSKRWFGYHQCVLVPYLAANGKVIWLGLCTRSGVQILQTNEINPAESYLYFVPLKLGNTQIPVKEEDLKAARMNNHDINEIPAMPTRSKQKVLFSTIMAETGFRADGEKKWIAIKQDEAERKFTADIQVLADKIKEKSINEDNLSLNYANSDPRHIEIEISDGQTTLHTRSILAAENSVLVTPHFRFIVTEKSAR